MQKDKVLQHWNDWAQKFGTDLRSTTKCQSIKTLEIAALSRRIAQILEDSQSSSLKVLEIGCGNGLNGIALCNSFPQIEWVGVDFSSEMVAQAHKNIDSSGVEQQMVVAQGDVLELDRTTKSQDHLNTRFDVIYTDRCLINLTSAQEQIRACANINKLLAENGRFLMLENSKQSHERLNMLRAAVGLPFRPVADFNVFIDEEEVLPAVQEFLDLCSVDDFGSLHDIVLYVLKPSIHEDQAVTYDDALMRSVTTLLLSLNAESSNFGQFGQNRLWTFRSRTQHHSTAH